MKILNATLSDLYNNVSLKYFSDSDIEKMTEHVTVMLNCLNNARLT